jgi:uncharacterized damage-inducible protein DinB
MSIAQQALMELNSAHEFFNRSTRNLTEDISTFAPTEGMMTTAQQIAHAAQTIDWFMEGAFRPEGFDMNFEEQMKRSGAYTSVAAAKEWFEKAVANARTVIGSKSDEQLMAPLPPGIMGGMPRVAVIGAINDHSAHHRGALTVYARLKGIVPPMPYMD